MHCKELQKNSTTVDKKKQYRPIQAYIMTNMYPGAYTKALNEMKKIKYIEKISVVTGDYDIVVKVNVKNLDQLNKLTTQLHKVNGVERTNTQVIEKDCKSLLRR
jgi:DNA-binding Lrp family transcriptional regulator